MQAKRPQVISWQIILWYFYIIIINTKNLYAR